MFPSISPKQSFPALESEVLAYWKANNTFQKSIDSRPEDNPYRFYDGPPFITGMPHYGHMLGSAVKDAVGRYWTMRGKRVERVWGWDCHGLPIEERVQKKLGLKSNADIEERGVKEFIDECYKYTGEVSSEWDWYIDKIGRWVDMDNAYRTMDQDYMESVMWVFSQLWNKGLIYEGKRVSLYSWKLGTPISNFEVAMDDTYQTVDDPAITVKFRLEMIKACGIIVENSKGEVLLGHNKKGFWSFPGGKGEAGETHEECATRELLEETGITYEITEKDDIDIEQYDIIKGRVFDNRRFRINIGDIPVGNGEPEIFHEWKYFAYDALPENIFEPTAHAIDILAQGKTQKNLPLSILAWTTTPWTIPANMALAVRNDIDYVLVENNGEQFILAKNRAEIVFKGKGEYTVIRELKGSELVGLGYIPPFPEYFYDRFRDGSLDPIPLTGGTQGGTVSETTSPTPPLRGARNPNHKIYHADFITDTDGTGIGHEAPEFGDVDFQLAKKEGIFISEAMDEAGKYTSQIFDYEGTHYLDLENPEKGANRINIERMKENGTLFKLEGITHRVPFCPRSGTPLMQKAQASWFIDIASQKDKLLKANEQINWFPEHLKFGRFAKGIESAPDWCISRTRYWGAPMPVWQNRDGSEKVVVSSREEIFERNKHYGQLTKVIFVRHGESEANIAKIHGNIDTKLSEKGKNQATELSEKLKKENIETIYCSHFTRAIDTIKDFSEEVGIKINIDDRLGERNSGDFEGQLFDAYAQEEYSKATEDHDYKYGKGESFNDLKKRGLECIREIIKNNPAKTVLIMGHSNIFSAILEEVTGESYIKEASNKLPNGKIVTVYMDLSTGKQLNLHKPYIDSIFLAPKNGEKAKRVLGIHGMMSDITKEGWIERKNEIENQGMTLDLVQFDRAEDPTYESWKETFDTIDFSQYDAILTNSMGGVMITAYLSEKGLSVPRIVMVSPGKSHSTLSGKYKNTKVLYDDLDYEKARTIAHEIIVIHAKDDETVPFESGKDFAEKIGAQFVPRETGNHMFKGEYDYIAKHLREGREQKVLGVQGYLKNESIIDFFQKTAENLQKEGINIHCPKFELGETVHYDVWEKIFLENIEGVDTVFTHSLGCRFSIDTIIKHQIFLKRLVLIAPPEGKHPNLQEFYSHLHEEMSQIRNFVDEVIVLYSTDDKPERLEATRNIIEQIGCSVVKVDGYGHFNVTENKLIEGLLQDGAPLTRIPEVLDVWMDSGSMPYAQMHYPFENKGEMEASFPADFIAEYVGQVRAWFYVMHVLGVLLNPNNKPNPTPSFTNVITTGVINGNDGRKMSKSFGNYPDPRLTIEKYGADPIRFYMLNSPLLSGGDMDFKEEQIIETVKGVMLPIWNTYSFFTTYANIDQWQHDDTEIWYSRHGESTSNVANRMSDSSDDPELTEKGREQSESAGKTLREQGKNFDIIIHTSRIRARHTAEIIAQEIGFTGVYIMDDRFAEQKAGEYAGKTLTEMADMHGLAHTDHSGIRKLYKNNSVEDLEAFEKRIREGYEDILKKHKGKRILIVAHAGTPRTILRHYFGMDRDEAHYDTRILNADPFRLMTTPLVSDLDRWILSKLQVLIGQVHDAMDGYDISRACRAIVEYMDHMTNWYVRLSRRRFWESGMTPDKSSAYETLYTVLVELSKLLAPFMPFISEAIYKGLTDSFRHSELAKDPGNLEHGFFVPQNDGADTNSVHLQYITRPNRHLISSELNRDMEICEHIVSLGLALRSQKNIRVRQPLGFVTITAELSEYYQSIIRDELNVKEVRFEDPERLAKKICKPDARKIGPRFGKDVQTIIVAAKNGDFIELPEGKIQVGNLILESGEYTLEYLPLEGVGDVIGGYGMVISLDTTIPESLKLEGYARDIVRLIQDMRKEAGYDVSDRISLSISGKGSEAILRDFSLYITRETLSTLVPNILTPDLEKSEVIDEGVAIVLSIQKVER